MNDKLAQIVATKREEVATGKTAEPLDLLKVRAGEVEPARSFFGAVTQPELSLRVIAEVKKSQSVRRCDSA